MSSSPARVLFILILCITCILWAQSRGEPTLTVDDLIEVNLHLHTTLSNY